jgi:tetratricopeptide (TPR) repeat protein
VSEAAHEAGDRRIESRALIALAHVALHRDGDDECARELAGRALAVAEEGDDVARFDASEVLGNAAWWEGDVDEVERLATERLAIAQRIDRRDLQVSVLLELNDVHNHRLEWDRAREPLRQAVELTAEGASPTTRGWTLRAVGRQELLEGRLQEAESALQQARELFAESGAALTLGRTLNFLAIVVGLEGDAARAEGYLREAIRVLKPLGDRGTLVESQRLLSQVLLAQGRVDEAERLALESRDTVGCRDVSSSSTSRLALGLVRAAQGRDEEAEELLREAYEILRPTGYRQHRIAPLEALAQFLRVRGRDDEAAEVEETLASLVGGAEAAQLS